MVHGARGRALDPRCSNHAWAVLRVGVQRRDLLSLAAEPSVSWRWGSLTLLSQTLQRTAAPDAKLESFSWGSWAGAAWP